MCSTFQRITAKTPNMVSDVDGETADPRPVRTCSDTSAVIGHFLGRDASAPRGLYWVAIEVWMRPALPTTSWEQGGRHLLPASSAAGDARIEMISTTSPDRDFSIAQNPVHACSVTYWPLRFSAASTEDDQRTERHCLDINISRIRRLIVRQCSSNRHTGKRFSPVRHRIHWRANEVIAMEGKQANRAWPTADILR